MTLSLTISETLKWFSSLPILMQESFWWWQCPQTTYVYIYYIGPIWDPCGLEYRSHMGYTYGIHIGNENGFWMGPIRPIWDLSGIQYGTHVILRYITHVSHVDPIYFPCGSHIFPIWIPHECQMFSRWLSCKSWFNPRFLGCILLMFIVFLWCMADVGTCF